MSVKSISIPGRKIELTLPLAPLVPPCTPAPSGLAWFSDTTGDFTEIAEAAYLSATAEAASPVLAVAKVLGETCGKVDWTVNWTPASGTGGDPAIKTDGESLYVYQKTGSAPGELRVSAQCAGQTLGPIALTLLAPVGGGGDCCADPQVDEISRYEIGDVAIFAINIAGLMDNSLYFIDPSVVFSGTPPLVYELFTSLRSLILAVKGGDSTTNFIVSVDVHWQCHEADQHRLLTWQMTRVIWGE